MKYGIGYAYWGNEWKADYIAAAKKIRECNCDIFEVGAGHIAEMTHDQLVELKNCADSLGLTLCTNQGPKKEHDIASPDPKVRQAGIDYHKKIMDSMAVIGSKCLAGAIYSFWPSDFVYTNKEEAWANSIPCMKELCEYAGERDIDIALEILNRFETYMINTVDECLEYIKKVNDPHCKILVDTFHANIEEDSIPDAFRKAGKLLAHVHVGENNRTLPGMNNTIPWKEIGKACKEIGYDGTIVMEPFLHAGGEVGKDIHVFRDLSHNASPEELDQMLKDSVKFLHEIFD